MYISCSADQKILEIPLEGAAVIGGYWSSELGLYTKPALLSWKGGSVDSLQPLEDKDHKDLNCPGFFAWESYFLQPGWLDAHVHLALDGVDFYQCLDNWADPSLIDKNIEEYLKHYLEKGIVAIRDGGDLPGFSWNARSRVQANEWLGPRVVSVHEAVNRKSMYGRFLGRGFDKISEWRDSEDGFFRQGLDQLKVIVTGLIRFDRFQVVGPTQWTVEELSTIVESAHRRGIQVMAHASGEEGISVSIEAGVDSIEHGYYIRGDQLEEMKERGIAWVPTVAPIGNILKYPTSRYSPEEIDILKRILDSQLTKISEAYALDVRLGVGTDAGAYLVPHADGFFDELAWMIQAGIPELEVYKRATAENALIMSSPNLGKLEIGTPLNFLQLAQKKGYIDK
jgi:imidazolonepropionase-like amidohydrolase